MEIGNIGTFIGHRSNFHHIRYGRWYECALILSDRGLNRSISCSRHAEQVLFFVRLPRICIWINALTQINLFSSLKRNSFLYKITFFIRTSLLNKLGCPEKCEASVQAEIYHQLVYLKALVFLWLAATWVYDNFFQEEVKSFMFWMSFSYLFHLRFDSHMFYYRIWSFQLGDWFKARACLNVFIWVYGSHETLHFGGGIWLPVYGLVNATFVWIVHFDWKKQIKMRFCTHK